MRTDISDYLIHLVSGETEEEQMYALLRILQSKSLQASRKKIKGGYNCICFTEAPLMQIRNTGLVNATGYSKYSKFGIMIRKNYLFNLGARPVIYQTENEFNQLPDTLKWRHVTLNYNTPIDYTWEREWRVNINSLNIESEKCFLIVPNLYWKKKLIQEFNNYQDEITDLYKTILDEYAEYYRDFFIWEVLCLH